MANINKRLDDLEKFKALSLNRKRSVVVLPDNGRSSDGFKVFDPVRDKVKIVPNERSLWPDGSPVFDSLSSPPQRVPGRKFDLTEDQWRQLRKAEPLHQKSKERK